MAVRTLTRIVALLALAVGIYLMWPLEGDAAVVPKIDPARTVVISGVIAKGNVLQLTPKLMELGKDRSKPIDLVISSPGGDMVTGFMFLNVMDNLRGDGVRFRCYIPTLAASMAFQILLHCDERYTLNHAFLLWHGVRVMGLSEPLTEEGATTIAKDFHKANEMILTDLYGILGKYMSKADIDYHFQHETLHVGWQLARLAPGFIVSLPSIPHLIEVMLDPKVTHAPVVKTKTDLEEEYETALDGLELDRVTKAEIAHLCEATVMNDKALQEICQVGIERCILTFQDDPSGEKIKACTISVIQHLGGKVR